MRVLAIDGGGVRGLIPAMFLEELERRTQKRTAELFDYIVGTSTGGIVALASVCPRPGEGTAPASTVVGFFRERVPSIFPAMHFGLARQLLEERYPAEGLEDALHVAFGDARLSDAVIDVMVTAYDVEECRPAFLRRSLARAEPGMDLPMRHAARATSAAPTYFTPFVHHDGERVHAFIDGGVFANNPMITALAHAREAGGDLTDVVAVSLGTGEVVRAVDFEHPHRRGVIRWASRLFSMTMDGNSVNADHNASILLGPEAYHRFNTPLCTAAAHFDDASEANMAALAGEARTLIDRESERIDHVAELLTASASSASAAVKADVGNGPRSAG